MHPVSDPQRSRTSPVGWSLWDMNILPTRVTVSVGVRIARLSASLAGDDALGEISGRCPGSHLNLGLGEQDGDYFVAAPVPREVRRRQFPEYTVPILTRPG